MIADMVAAFPCSDAHAVPQGPEAGSGTAANAQVHQVGHGNIEADGPEALREAERRRV